jgi:hypothetical protein
LQRAGSGAVQASAYSRRGAFSPTCGFIAKQARKKATQKEREKKKKKEAKKKKNKRKRDREDKEDKEDREEEKKKLNSKRV